MIVPSVMWRHWVVAVSCVALLACDKTPPSPGTDQGGGGTITGREQLGWTQSAADSVELATFHYAIYVDNARSELTSASCTPPAGASSGFSCAASLPALSSGSHTLELAAFIFDGTTTIESSRSAPLQVMVSTTARVQSSAPPWPQAVTYVTHDGSRLRLRQIADDVIDPTDFAFAPDGRIFLAEYGGHVRIVSGGRLLAKPALSVEGAGSVHVHLLALAVDPQFDRTHFVYAIYTTESRSGRRAFTLARFREAGDTLADRVVLRDQILGSSTDEGASLRVGADGKLFAAFDDGGIASLAEDLASPNGKILRLNADGTTPRDQAGGTPLYSYPYHSPRGLDWHPDARTLWVVDQNSPRSGRLNAVVSTADASNVRGVVSTTLALPQGTVPSSMAFGRVNSVAGLRDSLLVASDAGRHLLRIQFDRRNPTRVAAMERLLQDQIGGIRLVAVGPDGTIYLGTANAIGKLVAAE